VLAEEALEPRVAEELSRRRPALRDAVREEKEPAAGGNGQRPLLVLHARQTAQDGAGRPSTMSSGT
jgi:hypothetical protein